MDKHTLDFDQSLLLGLQADSQEAFSALFDAYWKELYELAFHRLADRAEAEDMVQEIFISLWDRRKVLHIGTPLFAYLRRALKYKIIRWYSKASMHRDALLHIYEARGDSEETVMELLMSKELNLTLQETINSFPENMREIFKLKAEDYSINEIAAALGLAEQTVKNNHSEALRRLKVVISLRHPELSHVMITMLLVSIS